MRRVVLFALLYVATVFAAIAQFKANNCEEVVDEECEALLGPQSPERQKEIIWELKKQQEELLKLDKMRKAGAKADSSADLKTTEPDPNKK
jgi:hypothetical protein